MRSRRNRRKALSRLAHRALIKVSRVIGLALRAGHAIAATPWRGKVCGVDFAGARKNSLGHPGSGGCGLGRVHGSYSRMNCKACEPKAILGLKVLVADGTAVHADYCPIGHSS